MGSKINVGANPLIDAYLLSLIFVDNNYTHTHIYVNTCRTIKRHFHIERVSVAGATVRSLAHAVEVDYFNLWIPLDLLICVGLNDFIKERSALK